MSKAYGDGVGFDVLSFDESGDGEQFIEVKTTGLAHFRSMPANEVRCSEDCPSGSGSIGSSTSPGCRGITSSAGRCRGGRLEPVQYRASI
ncbi:MAG: DUF3883 domain-containing protein [Singulisphaera sp.]